jgi:MFS family permease
MVQEPPRVHSLRSKRYVQLVAGLGSCIAPFLVAAMVVAAPTIGGDLGAEVASLAWLTAAFFLVAAALLIPFGRIADVKGSKKVFTAGMAIYALSGTICALAPDINILILGRALTGAGAAMVFGTSIALLSLVFPEKERGKAIGLNVTFMFAGFTIGLLAGGFLTFYLSWRTLFAIAIVLAVFNLFLIFSKVRGECELSREKSHDLVGMALFSISLLLVFYGLSAITSDIGRYCLLTGGVIAFGLLVWERHYPRPMIAKEVATNRLFLLAIATNIFFQAGSFAIPFLLSLYSQLNLGLDPREASFVLLVPQVLMTVMSSLSGRLMTRVRDRSVTGLGALINAGGLAVLLLTPGAVSVVGMITALAFIGVGTGLFMPAVIDWAMGSIARKDYGVASAATETARLMGMTISNVVLILIISAVAAGSGEQNAVGDLSLIVRLCALAFLALTLSVLVPSFIRKEARPGR